jgi:hypothetical protein
MTNQEIVNQLTADFIKLAYAVTSISPTKSDVIHACAQQIVADIVELIATPA